ncbi:MAG: hypothetical protein ACOY40_07390 [Bacillota bacterium]
MLKAALKLRNHTMWLKMTDCLGVIWPSENRGGKMWAGISLAVLGLAAGIALGLNLPFTMPNAYAKYMSLHRT